jgi:hypothetical protein
MVCRDPMSHTGRLLQLLGEAELLDPAARAEFLDALRAEDASLAAELESLLAASARDGGVLDASAWRALEDTSFDADP